MGKILIPEEKGEIIKILVENKAYPVCSKGGKIFFIKPKKSDFFDRLKDDIIERLELETEEDCKKVREILKGELAMQRTTKPIKKWFKDERPREMLVKQGAENLNSAKLLAILLRTGSEGVSAEELARRLLNHFGSLRAIDSASISDLQEIDGIGMAKATQIKAALEIGKRFYKEKAEKKKRISSSKEAIKYVFNYYRPYLMDSKKEFFNVVLLDGRNKPIGNVKISEGSVDTSLVDPKEIIKEATKKSASALILVHNHPSGEPEPSKEDMEITNRIIKACDLVGLRVLDHIIIGKNRRDYFSFLDKGLIKED
ncbi:DNA repair protein RadC [Patescibacteria group bacterium]|nr:DNA repair protein RadC [Patescibacteria group bacterium]